MTTPRKLAIAGACAAALLVTGCGPGTQTGNKGILKTSPGATNGHGLTETTPPATKPSSKPSATRPAPTRTTTPPVRKTTPPTKPQEPPPFIITINGDKSGKPLIDPPQASVYTGYRVQWRNADTKPHGVISRNGAINSGPCNPQTGVTRTCIQPGGSYTWVAGPPGTYEYKDSSRPYVNVQIMVAPR